MTIVHPLPPEDAPAVASMRAAAAAHKGEPLGPAARPMFDAMMASTPAADGVQVEPGTVGGIPGLWCRPTHSMPRARLLYIHGGGYVLGSPPAFAHFAAHIAVRARADTFVPDYRLAPEHPFPAAIDDVVAAYQGLPAGGASTVAVAGDSAGGGLALSLLSLLAAERPPGPLRPVAAAVMSPWTDLTLSAPSMATRAAADPIFTRATLRQLADLYLQGHDASHPQASPLFAPLHGVAPVRIDVGDDEILLDDAVRYAERARLAGVSVTLHVWTGMSHVFQSSLGSWRAAAAAVDDIGSFLRSALTGLRPSMT
jgi:monoterpene epsilon-lactone hydrolase